MTDVKEAAQDTPPAPAPISQSYARFIILCDARTGSNMLASSINTNPEIICFRELFNPIMEGLGYHVPGYNNNSAADRALRDRDFRAFLQQRVFCQHPPGVRAVGFKMPYSHFWAFPGLLNWLVQDQELQVVALSRKNLLRQLVSLRIAQETGGWAEDRKRTLRQKMRLANTQRWLRHPLRAGGRLRRYLFPREPEWKTLRSPVTLTPDECHAFFQKAAWDIAHFHKRFAGHTIIDVTYEELVDDRHAALERVQQFLGVAPRVLDPTTRKQNPESLRELIDNYDDLYAAFRDTDYAQFFD